MIFTYQQLKEKKEKGENLDWDHITKEQLESLFIDEVISNNRIAELYGVTPSRVSNKRKKWDISIFSPKYLYKEFMNNDKNLTSLLNENAKVRLFQNLNIDSVSKALTHYIFRNGPVEDMHSVGKLTEEDMKTLNKYMVNRIAGLLKLVQEGEWLKISIMLDYLKYSGSNWDKVEYDTEEIEVFYQLEKEKLEKSLQELG